MSSDNIRFQKLIDEGYHIDTSRYIKEGFELFKKNIGGFIGFYAFVFGVSVVFAYLPGEYTSLLFNFLQPAITAGILIVANEVFKGNSPDIAKYFEGFKFYL